MNDWIRQAEGRVLRSLRASAGLAGADLKPFKDGLKEALAPRL